MVWPVPRALRDHRGTNVSLQLSSFPPCSSLPPIPLVRWRRDTHTPPYPLEPPGTLESGGVVVLGDAGFIANRNPLIRQLGLEAGARDAAILEALWHQRGPRSIGQLCGAYSAVLWDAPRERLILVADRLGIYPFYLGDQEGELTVSLGLEGLLATLPARPALNRASLVAQLHGRALAAGATFFSNITTTRPATVTEFFRHGRRVRRYWRLGEEGPVGRRPGTSWVESLGGLLIQVVGEYAAGEATGVTLSSGLDSASVAWALACVRGAESSRAISWTAPELPKADETSGARAVSERLGIGFVPVLADRCWTLEGDTDLRPPLAGPPLTYFARLWQETFAVARQHGVELLFSGASGDHLFGGRIEPAADLLLTGRWGALREELAAHREENGVTDWQLLRHRILGPMFRAYWPSVRPQGEPTLPWLEPEALADPPADRRWGPLAHLPGRRERWRRLHDPLLPRILAETTAAAGRAGVKLRHPLVDHRLIELAAALPSEACYHRRQTKSILRELLRDHLPAEVVEQPGKIVPNTIAERGLREREIPKAEALMTDMRLEALGLVNEARLRAHYRQYVERGTGTSTFWHTLSLEAWLRCHGDVFGAA